MNKGGKYMRKFIKFIPLGMLLLAAFAPISNQIVQVRADEEYTTYDPRYYGQNYFNKRGSNGYPLTNEEQWNDNKNQQYICYTRFVFQVNEAGSKTIYLNLGKTGGNPVDSYLYLDNSTKLSPIVDNNASLGTDHKIDLNLTTGKHVLIVDQIWNYAEFSKICFPNSIEVLTANSDHYYDATYANSTEVCFSFDTNKYDSNAVATPGVMFAGQTGVTVSYSSFNPRSFYTFKTSESINGEYFITASNSLSNTKELRYTIDGGSNQTIVVAANANEVDYSIGNLQAGNHTIEVKAGYDSENGITVHSLSVVPDAEIVAIDSITGSIRASVGEAFDVSGLTIMGHDLNSDPVNLTSLVDITVNSPSTNVIGSGSNASVTATLKSDPTIILTVNNIDWEVGNFKTYWNVDDLKSSVTVHGRNIPNNDYIGLDWTNSGIEFNFVGSGSISLNTTINGMAEVVAEVDGVAQSKIALSTGETVVASNISYGNHVVRIYKTSSAYTQWRDPNNSFINLVGLRTSYEGAVITPVDVSSRHNVEFIGDSITAADGVDSGENGYYSHTRYLEQAYNLNMNVIANCGSGLVRGYANNQINEIYDYTSYFRDSSTSLNASAFVPEVVVVGIGSNDMGKSNYDINTFLTGVESFSTHLKSLYSGVKILWTYGAYIYRNYVAEYATKVASLGDTFVELPILGAGVNNHPNIAQQKEIAEIISYKLCELLGEENAFADHYVIEAEDQTIVNGEKKTGQAGNWSQAAFVGSFGLGGYVEFSFKANRNGSYRFEIGTSSDKNAPIFYSIDGGEPIDSGVVSNYYGGNWDPKSLMGDPDIVTFHLSKGTHTIRFYAPTYSGPWINYDYFEIIDVTKDEVQEWIDTYLKFDTIDIDDEGSGACLGYYDDAKDALLALDAGDATWTHVNCFVDPNNTEFAQAKARYEAWASANTDANPYGTSGVNQASTISNATSDNVIMIVAIVLTSTITIFLTYFLVMKKRKTNI